ncbi:ECF transporter S component [Acidaminobacterium chupaoyuni]
MKKNQVYKMVLAALFLAAGVALPQAFHMIPNAGRIFLPMHLPVLLCGLICGWEYGLIVGAMTPLLSGAVTGMPILFPIGVAMMFELATYGAVTGLVVKKQNHFVALLAAMLAGRAVSGVANAVLMGIAGKAYGLNMFLAGAFVTALPGICIQLVVVPLLMTVLKRTHALDGLEA